MFRRHSIAISPSEKSISPLQKTPLKSNTRGWIKLLLSALIPLMIGIFTIVITILQNKLSLEQREQSERQADNLRQENLFATYIDEISKLMLIGNNNQTLIHIRMKTLTVLRQLGSTHKQYVFLFLYESELIYRRSSASVSFLLPIHRADFNNIFFEGTIENPCKLSRAYIPGVHLSNSTFLRCFMDGTIFSNATMHKTKFHYTFLIRVSFKSASLNQANFSHSKLSYTNLIGTSLVDADFTNTTFLYYEDTFMNTDLTRARISIEQFHNIKFSNCILPNGTWGLIDTTNRLKNGDVEENCNTSYSHNLTEWTTSPLSEIKAFQYNNTNDGCYFRVTSCNDSRKAAYVSQTIILTDFSLLISASLARYHASAYFQCFGDQSVSIELQFKDYNELNEPRIFSKSISGNNTELVQISGQIRKDAYSVRFYITFIAPKKSNLTLEENYCICDNVSFSVSKI